MSFVIRALAPGVVLVLCLGLPVGLASAQDVAPSTAAKPTAPAPEPIEAGATTLGGLREGSKVLHVTTLRDSGRGSLRAALNVDGPKVIVFDVGGRIILKSDLKISKPFVTIAGQTAPSPGVTLWGASLRVRAHDVVVQHIAVRAGPAKTRAENDNRDAISIDGNARAPADHHSYQVRLENVSASWSVDETVSLWYATTRNVTLRNSIVAEALQNAGHPKGPHSMGLLVGTNVQGAEISGNLLVSNAFRNPAIGRGASVFIANNYVVNPGQNAIHFYKVGRPAATKGVVINNVIEAGRDTKPNLNAIIVPLGRDAGVDDEVLVSENEAILGPKGKALGFSSLMNPTPPAPVTSREPVLATNAVKAHVLRYAGARPADRDAIDQRIIDQVNSGTARIVNTPPEWNSAPGRKAFRKARPPKQPFEIVPETGETRLETWLCQQNLTVGGAPSARCQKG